MIPNWELKKSNTNKRNRLAIKLRSGILLLLFLLPFAEARYKAGETFQDCTDCPEMVVVPAGKFMMGSPKGEPDRSDAEGPLHQVTIPEPFAVGKYEVTVAQFKVFIEETKYNAGSCWRSPPGFRQSSNHPVVCVSWNDAQAYIGWLSKKTKHKYRLLTEAEWEYGARAGTTTAYYFGSKISPTEANYHPSAGTTAVGSYPTNKFGLHDVNGNAWEWVEDCWHSNYNGAPTDGSAWSDNCGGYSGDSRVLRGGSWASLPFSSRSAHRDGVDASDRNRTDGFRVAQTLIP